MNTVRFKQTLREGRIAAGTWVFEFNTPGIARLLASTGVDFVVYDMEHSGFGIDTVRSLIAQSHGLDLAVLVRPPAGEYHLIAPLLDLGAGGVIVPRVETVKDAAKAANACRYHPEGGRGAAFSVAHDDFQPGEVAAKIRAANQAVVCGLLIETALGVKNINAILNVSGVDLIWVGFLDLSLSLGIPGQFTHPGFEAAVSCILEAAESHGTPVGILADTPDAAIERVKQGFRCISYSGDIWLLQRALSDGIQAIRLGVECSPNPKAAAPTG